MHRYLLLLLVAACATAPRQELRHVPMNMREVAIEDRRMNVTAEISNETVDAIAADLRTREADLYGIWSIPGRPSHYLLFVEQPMVSADNYGAQVFVARLRDKRIDVLFESGRMMDVEFVEPSFFRDDSHLLLLADIGAENSWGLMALDLTGDTIRDLGQIDVVRPETVMFKESAIPAAHVFVEPSGYVVEFDGPVIEEEKVLAARGQRAVFVETAGRFILRETK